ncbi:hypothetical protein NDU88_006201 [Pleurodeles waltl]|uniref:Uncharacterized protein n=1 Tax=Pleurodeles waltl TaxID=8319 RepID=A0AAV7QK52_PLEWA|nr:hypothetical protein NDU88_006201 [Pleurodeles waltl]
MRLQRALRIPRWQAPREGPWLCEPLDRWSRGTPPDDASEWGQTGPPDLVANGSGPSEEVRHHLALTW